MLKLELEDNSYDFLIGLPPKQFRQVMIKILALLVDPRPHDSRFLEGYPFRRADVGEYRIIYEVDGDVLRVILVGKRNDGEVYRKLNRLLHEDSAGYNVI